MTQSMFSYRFRHRGVCPYHFRSGWVAWTGSAEQQSLGFYWFKAQNKPLGLECDSVYRMELIFPHVAESLALDFISHREYLKTDQS